ncbi:MAG TPA: aspartate aminotransferase family protein [Actinomycetota bacterium]
MDEHTMLDRAADIERDETARLLERTPASAALFERAVRSMPLGVASSFQAADPYPIYLARGRGSRVWDVDGTEYVDYHGGFGTMAVGHAHPKVEEAIARAASTGTHFAVTTEATVALAEELCRRFGMERVRFSNSGTEATMDALRVARAATGRERLVKIEGSYHGHHDAVMFSVVPSMAQLEGHDAGGNIPFSGGIPKHTADELEIVPFNDAPALERMLEGHPGQFAALMIEPVMMNIGIVPPDPGYLERVRELCTKHGVVLIFDEVKTGATVAPGGATERFGVQPDLACFAKAIGGGTPLGAFGGAAAVMDEIGRSVAHQGTFNGNPLCVAAALAALTEVMTAEAHAEADRVSARLADGCRAAIAAHGIPAHVQQLGLKGSVSYRREPLRSYRDYLETHPELFAASWPWLVNRGVFMTPGDEEQWLVSVQHTDSDVDRYLDAFEGFCSALAPPA